MQKPKQPREPFERVDTLRRQIKATLEKGTYSAKDLSAAIRTAERDVYGHLDHIRRTMGRGSGTLVIVPPECRKCGFVFTRMDRLRKPGKCPVCRGESIHEPLFRIDPDGHGEA